MLGYAATCYAWGVLNGKKPLVWNSPDWKAFYTKTDRREIDKLTQAFLSRDLGYKALFGGHSGNGKSTEIDLNEIFADRIAEEEQREQF